MTIMPPSETHDETERRDDRRDVACGINQAITMPYGERDEKNTRKTHQRQGKHNETPAETKKNETRDETTNDRKQIG